MTESLKIERIQKANSKNYNYMEKLLVEAFPIDEYRDLDSMRLYTDEVTDFHNNIITDNNIPIGIITYWNLIDFYYIEHFAIDTKHRNKGYGNRVLKVISKKINRPIILEVELPENEMAKRRIKFYEQAGFTILQRNYHQPPYRKEGKRIPMYLMISGDLKQTILPELAEKRIHKKIYNT